LIGIFPIISAVTGSCPAYLPFGMITNKQKPVMQ